MEDTDQKAPEEKTFFGIIFHSFFVIPFIIAVSAVILFSAMHWLTREQLTAYDYIEQVKVGGLTKRWQAAFELSKILANPNLIPAEKKFEEELSAAFRNAKDDDTRVRQYLALAMARTNNPAFLETLVDGLNKANDDDTRRTLIYALGMLRDQRAVKNLLPYLENTESRIRSMTVAALGTIGDEKTISALREMLKDTEPNVQWGAAISLANLKDPSGKNIIENLLNRSYLSQFKEVDQQEQTQLILHAIAAVEILNDHSLKPTLNRLSEQDLSMKVRSTAHSALDKIK